MAFFTLISHLTNKRYFAVCFTLDCTDTVVLPSSQSNTEALDILIGEGITKKGRFVLVQANLFSSKHDH